MLLHALYAESLSSTGLRSLKTICWAKLHCGTLIPEDINENRILPMWNVMYRLEK